MRKDLIPNPPSHELAKQMVEDVAKAQTFKPTLYVRAALANAITDHYDGFTAYLKGGRVTGSAQADMYMLAGRIVEWETEAGRPELFTALENGTIRLVDIVKRIAPELRKMKFDVIRGVCVGSTTQGLENNQPLKIAG